MIVKDLVRLEVLNPSGSSENGWFGGRKRGALVAGGGAGYEWSVARWVLHVDLDQFIAAVEVLRHPELRGRPVVVGGDGDPTKRGVVSTASYEAREHGVHSGLPLRTAAKRLPDAVFLPVDRAAYEEVSETVMEVLRSTGAVVEVLGWDEAFVGVDTRDPEAFARSLARGSRRRRNWTARWGSARTSCRPRSPPDSASRPGCSG